MDYANTKPVNNLAGPRTRAIGSMVDDSKLTPGLKNILHHRRGIVGPIDGLSHAQMSHAQVSTTPKPTPKPKKKNLRFDIHQLDLFNSDFRRGRMTDIQTIVK